MAKPHQTSGEDFSLSLPSRVDNGHRRRISDAAFDQWWAVYPRKVGRLEAKREWDRIRPSAVLIDAMMHALAWQAEQDQWQESKFIPHGRTYLHNARWEDEQPRGPAAKPDGYGHVPPCATHGECIEKVIREGRDARAKDKKPEPA